MSENAIMQALTDLICETFVCGADGINRGSTAADIDGWDSLSHAILLLRVERRFHLKIDRQAFFALDSVGDLADLIAAHEPGSAATAGGR